MKSKIVPVKNVARLTEAAHALLNRAPGLPGMGLVTGETGWGKSTATTWLYNRVNGIFVRAFAVWTPSDMLAALCEELDIPQQQKCSKMLKGIVQKLAEDPRPIFIDEADYLLGRSVMTDCARDIHDAVSVPVILIGMGDFERRISHRKQFTGRIAQNVRFQPLDAEDTRRLADQLCEVKVADDLLERIHRASHGSVRLTVISLAKAEQRAKVKGLGEIGSAEWGAKDEFFTGEAPIAAPVTSKVKAIA